MIPMIKINLLPYREALLQKQKQQFKSMMTLALLLALVLAALGYFGLKNTISLQEERNQALQDGIVKLNQEITTVKQLEKEKADFLARKQKVEELENQRFEAARIIDTLNILAPEGLYLTKITSKSALQYQIEGKAISDSKIAMLMRALPSTGLFKTPELVSIKKGGDAQEFTLQADLNRPEPEQASAPVNAP